MVTSENTLGTCPHCGRDIARNEMLIDFENAAGNTVVFADCRECDDVVRLPQ